MITLKGRWRLKMTNECKITFMNRPTSQPHSPLPHGLWSAQRLLQHLQNNLLEQCYSLRHIESTCWPSTSLFIDCLTFFHRLSDCILVTCITNTFRVVGKSLNWEPWPERDKNFEEKKVSKKCETQSTYWDTQHRRAFLPLPQHRCLEPCIGCGRCLNRDPAITSIKIAKLVTSQFVSISIWYKVFL